MQRPTVWHSRTHIARARVPRDLRPWLTEPRSLTQRIRAACHGEFALQLLAQWRGRPLTEETVSLALSCAEHAVVRHVCLQCAGRPWVFARSIFPNSALMGPGRQLALLGERPLGALLFSNKGMRRLEVEFALLAPRQHLYELVCEAVGSLQEPVWARRSKFLLNHKPLLVTEVFLPAVGVCGASQ